MIDVTGLDLMGTLLEMVGSNQDKASALGRGMDYLMMWPERWTDLGGGRYTVISSNLREQYEVSSATCTCPAYMKALDHQAKLRASGASEDEVNQHQPKFCYHRGAILVLEAATQTEADRALAERARQAAADREAYLRTKRMETVDLPDFLKPIAPMPVYDPAAPAGLTAEEKEEQLNRRLRHFGLL